MKAVKEIKEVEKDSTRIEKEVNKHLEKCWLNDIATSERKGLIYKMWCENKFAHYLFEFSFALFLEYIAEKESEIYNA